MDDIEFACMIICLLFIIGIMIVSIIWKDK